jgi:hypothetical protein
MLELADMVTRGCGVLCMLRQSRLIVEQSETRRGQSSRSSSAPARGALRWTGSDWDLDGRPWDGFGSIGFIEEDGTSLPIGSSPFMHPMKSHMGRLLFGHSSFILDEGRVLKCLMIVSKITMEHGFPLLS